MRRTVITAAYLVAMVVIIVAVDVLFLRHHLWIRLGTNIGIVVLFLLGYLAATRRRQLR